MRARSRGATRGVEIAHADQLDTGHVGRRRGNDRAGEAQALRLGEPPDESAGPAAPRRRDRARRPRPSRPRTGAVFAGAGNRQRDREVGTRLRRRARHRPRSRTRRGQASTTPARRCTIATSIDSRPPSNDWATRRGIGAEVATTSDCTSTHSGRVPSSTAATTDPDAPTRRSARKSELGSATDRRPSPVISIRPSSSVGPKRCLSAREHAERVMTVAFEREHGVDDVLQRARAGQRPVLGDVADQQRRDAELLGQPLHARAAPSRTWLTEPGPPGASGSCTAWIESIAITSGWTASACAHTSGKDVSHTTKRSGVSAPRRSARNRTCAADSSAHTSRPRAPASAIAPSACSTSVLLPMPGSPPINVSDPATSPPPSTRSSSGTCVARRGAPSGSTSTSGTGLVSGRAASRARPGRRGRALERAPFAAVGAPAEPLRRLVATSRAGIANTCSGHGGTVAAACDKLGQVQTGGPGWCHDLA